jgi:DNA repair exonuclease SbcCD nuclease subunit
MKVLIWSDIHLHNWPYGSTLVDGVNSRLLAQRKVMTHIADYAAENDIDHIVFCGDLFHQHGKIDAQVLKVAYEGIKEILEKSNVYMDMLVGNHDTAMKDMSTHALHWLNAFSDLSAAMPQVRVIDKPTHNDLVDRVWPFSFLPYTEDEAVLKQFFKDANPICFMHQGVVDVPMASGFVVNEIMNVDMIPDHVQHVFTGHYHPFHMLEKATVVGSVMQHNWADMGDTRGFLVVDTDTLAIKQVNSHAPKFTTCDMGGAGSLGDSKVDERWHHREWFKNNYVRVTNFEEGSIPNIRKEILAAGAASVEFVIQRKTYKSNVVKAITGKGLSVPELVREYEDEHNISQERRKVGKELMK